MTKTVTDVAIIGAGHNGLVAAVMLARHGLTVSLFEEQATIGGAAKTEYPFGKAPKLGASSGAYLFGLMPPELIAKLQAKFTLIRRDPHYFLPTTDHRYLLFGSDVQALRQQFLSVLLRTGLESSPSTDPRNRSDPRRSGSQLAGRAALRR